MPASLRRLLAEAQRDYNGGRYNRAVDALNSAIANSPTDASLHSLLGESYYELREFPRAAASLERAVQLEPKNSDYHDWLGRAYGRRAEESIFLSAMTWARKTHHEFEIAVELDSRNFEAQRDLIRYEMNAPSTVGGGDDKALKHIDALEKIDSIQGQLARGEFFATKKRMTRPTQSSGKFWKRVPIARAFISRCAITTGNVQKPEKMSEAIGKAEQIDPDDRRLKFYRGVLLVMEKKNSSEAEMLLKSYIATVPDNSDLPAHAAAYEWLGKLYRVSGAVFRSDGRLPRIAFRLIRDDRSREEEVEAACRRK